MSSIILCCFPRFRKHVQLIKRVYPSKPGEEGPKSSQLSYLLFYATYRPGKLKKIGNYLVRRVERDARKERDGHHKTTLAILNALMDECHAHLNLFGKNVIKILYRYIKFGDVELVKMASVTYMKFNSYYDGRLSSDPEFENDYLQLLDLFCHLCTFDENVEKTVKQESILAGLEAIKSIAFSNFLFTTRCEHYISKILPPILSNIKKLTLAIRPKSDAEHNYLTSSKRFSIFDDLITEDELGNLALSCLQKLVRSTNAATAGLVLDPTFDYIEQNNKWWPSDFACVAARGIAQSGSTQVKTMLVASLLSRMQPPMRTKSVKSISQINASTVTDPTPSSPPSQPGNSVPIRTRITLVKVLAHVIADQSNTMIAISVYELVDAVMAQLSGLPAKIDNEMTEGDQVKISGVDEAAMILMLRRAVYRAIENLLIHPQYPTQPKDIINHLVVNYPTSDLLSPELKRVIITSIDHLYSLSVVANPASPESHNPSNNLLAIPSMMVTVNASVGENLKEHVNGSLSGSSNGIAGGVSKKKKKDRIRPEILVGALEWLVDLHPDVRHVTQKLLIKLLSDMETASWPSPFTPDEVQIVCIN
ncbi:hypothetical protein BKA69DRAFT_296324 [Paraphysoderma sedebokerense]|nr:hypothetical protein BKA69DRAFT_296324 [Paraphysoderma sedebokerense]